MNTSRLIQLRLRARRTARTKLGIPRTVRYSLGWDVIAGGCTGLYTGLAFPFFIKIARGDLHASEAAIAFMAAAPFIGNLLSPVWARQMEGRAKMPFVIGSWLCARALLLLMPLLAWGAWPFVLLVGGTQFVGTISSPAYTSLMRDIYPDRARGRLMGYVRVAAQSMMFLATMAAGRLLDHTVSFRILFPCAALFGFAAAYAFWHVRPLRTQAIPVAVPAMTTAQFARDTLRILRDNEPYRWFAFSVFTYGFGNLMVQPLYQLYQIDVLHIQSTQIANLANFASLWSIAGAFFWGRLMDHLGPPRVVLLSIVSIALIPTVYLFHPSIPVLACASALSGFGLSGIELAYLASILLYAEPHRIAQYQSLHSLLFGLRGVIASLLGIPLMRFLGYPPVFIMALVVMLAGAMMQWLATTQPARPSPHH